MRRLKDRRIAHRKDAELDVTPFMNMMMILVPALLLSVVFSKITVIDLDFPVMRRFFCPEEITDSGLLRRVANLEYLAQHLGSRLVHS